MSSQPLRILIVWANPFNKNLGVAALAYSALALLNDVTKESKIPAEFTFYGSTGHGSQSVIIDNKTISFNNIPGLDLLKPKSFVKFLLNPSKFKINQLPKFDYVFDIAEGDSFTDIYGNQRFWKILNSKRFFSLFSVPQVLLPQTIGPFKSITHERAAFNAMNKLQMVISRDQKSYTYSSQFLNNQKIVETIDVAFYMPYQQTHFKTNKIKIGINVSGLLWNGGYTKNNQFDMKTDYRRLVRDTLTYFVAQENIDIHLVPHVIPVDNPVEDDYAASEEIRKEFPTAVLAPRFETPIDAKSYISGLDFFTGARMHACIAAFSTGVPVYPMAYSRKFNGLFGSTLQYEHLGDCVNQETDQVLKGLQNAFASREKLKQEIIQSHQHIIQPRLTLLKNILSGILNK